MNRTDFADPAAGVLATLEQHVPLAVFEREGSGADAELQVETRPLETAVALEGDLLGRWVTRACEATGRLIGSAGTTEIKATGAITDGDQGDSTPQPDRAVLRRSIAVLLDDGGLFSLASALPSGSERHDEEEIAAALADEGRPAEGFAEVLLSTEYGPDGLQRRATLELWPDSESDRPVRGGGTALAVTGIELPTAASDIAWFEWSIAGRPGIGRYEIIRAR